MSSRPIFFELGSAYFVVECQNGRRYKASESLPSSVKYSCVAFSSFELQVGAVDSTKIRARLSWRLPYNLVISPPYVARARQMTLSRGTYSKEGLINQIIR